MCVRESVRVFMTRCTRFYQQIIRALLTTFITLHGEHISLYADDTRVSYNLLQGLNEGIRTPNKLLIYTIKEVLTVSCN